MKPTQAIAELSKLTDDYLHIGCDMTRSHGRVAVLFVVHVVPDGKRETLRVEAPSLDDAVRQMRRILLGQPDVAAQREIDRADAFMAEAPDAIAKGGAS